MTAPADVTHSGTAGGTGLGLAIVNRLAVANGMLVGAALAAGLVVALLTIHLVGAWDARLAFH